MLLHSVQRNLALKQITPHVYLEEKKHGMKHFHEKLGKGEKKGKWPRKRRRRQDDRRKQTKETSRVFITESKGAVSYCMQILLEISSLP